MKLTPFHDRTSGLNRRQMWFNWDRHIVPDAYRDLASELRATRERVSMGDMSPLSKYEIRGPDAPRFIDRLVTRNTTSLEPGQVAYTPWTDDGGKIVGDGLVFRMEPDVYRDAGRPSGPVAPSPSGGHGCRDRGCVGGLRVPRDPGSTVARGDGGTHR